MKDYQIERSNKMPFLILQLICHNFIIKAYLIRQMDIQFMTYYNLGYDICLNTST